MTPAQAAWAEQHRVSRSISALTQSIPGQDASASARAAWFERKAGVYEAMAAVNPDLAGDARVQAGLARAVAADYRAEDVPTVSAASDAAVVDAAVQTPPASEFDVPGVEAGPVAESDDGSGLEW